MMEQLARHQILSEFGPVQTSIHHCMLTLYKPDLQRPVNIHRWMLS